MTYIPTITPAQPGCENGRGSGAAIAWNRAYDALRLPDELALAQANPGQWLGRADLESIRGGAEHYATAAEAGLFTNEFALPKHGWLLYLSGETERAVEMLGMAAERQTGQGRALSLYYRGAILNRSGEFEGAVASLDQSLNERPDLVLAREERGEALWQLGRREEAIAAWTDAVRANPALPLANNFLSGAYAETGDFEQAIEHINQQALGDMRRLLALLRDSDDELSRSPQPSLAAASRYSCCSSSRTSVPSAADSADQLASLSGSGPCWRIGNIRGRRLTALAA